MSSPLTATEIVELRKQSTPDDASSDVSDPYDMFARFFVEEVWRKLGEAVKSQPQSEEWLIPSDYVGIFHTLGSYRSNALYASERLLQRRFTEAKLPYRVEEVKGPSRSRPTDRLEAKIALEYDALVAAGEGPAASPSE